MAPSILAPDEMTARIKWNLDLLDIHYMMILLLSLHARLGNYLPADLCVYVLTTGQTSAGKSRTAQYIVEISHGSWLVDATNTYIYNAYRTGKSGKSKTLFLGIDQLDEQSKKNPELIGLLESSNLFNCVRGINIKKGGEWEVVDIECGGPKAFSSITPPGETLLNRCYEIQCVPCDDGDKALLSARWAWRESKQGEISDTLDELAEMIKKIPVATVQAYMLSSTHLDRLKPLERHEGRRMDIAHTLELCRWLLSQVQPGWDFDVVAALDYELSNNALDVFSSILAKIAFREKWGEKDNIDIQAEYLAQTVKREYSMLGDDMNTTICGTMMKRLGFTEEKVLKFKVKGRWFYRFDSFGLALLPSTTGLVQISLDSQRVVRWGVPR